MSLRLLRSSAGHDPATLRPGQDLVLDVAPEHALSLPDGAAVDDHLDQRERAATDRAAWQSLASWRATRGPDLVVAGADLGHVAELELIAQCFLPAERLRRALETLGVADHIEAHGFDASALSAVRGLAPQSRVLSGVPAPPPSPPTRAGRTTPIVRVAEATGIPPWVRGDIICVPYWHLTGVYVRLARRRHGPRPVPVGVSLTGLHAAMAANVVARGGWGGRSGATARARSKARVGEQLGRLADAGGLDRWARDVLLRVSGSAPAELAHARRMLRGRARLVVTPFDSPERERPLLAAARERGVASLVVQHGFDAELGDPDRRLADRVAVWSNRDMVVLADSARGKIAVTGNPGADVNAGASSSRRTRGRTIVLVEYPGRLSSRVDGRIGLKHLAAALMGLARARPGTAAVIRPHPSDPGAATYLRALAGLGDGLNLVADAITPIEPLLRTADLCIGAISTATLQSAVSGLSTIFLDVSGTQRPWPFDGSLGALPVARSATELAEIIPDVMSETGVRGADAAQEALGATGKGGDRVLELIDSLVHR